jgi:hypothetical protein
MPYRSQTSNRLLDQPLSEVINLAVKGVFRRERFQISLSDFYEPA